MSASAEVYISASDIRSSEEGDQVIDAIDNRLEYLGFSTKGSGFIIGRYLSGLEVEVKGHSVSYDVFLENWASGLITEVYAINPMISLEISVYNLDRTADVMLTTWDVFSENGQQAVND